MKRMNWQAVRAAFVLLTGLVVASMVNAQSNQKPHPENSPTPLSVSVVNTPTVNVGTLPAVTVGGTVNIGNTVPVQVTNPVQPPSSVTVNNTAAQPVPVQANPSAVTPMGQLPSNHVVLYNQGTQGCTSWFRIAPDGSGTAFTIPAGQEIVITDMDFFAGSTSVAPGVYGALKLNLGNNQVPVLNSAVMADSLGDLATQQHLTSGIVMSVLPTCQSGPGNGFDIVTLRGYLIPAS